jgi:anaerobic sulfite reductase subunit C
MVIEVSGYQVETCSGPGGCPNWAIIYKGLAEDIRQRLIKQDLKAFLRRIVRGPLKIHHEFRISISDCPNACSRPQIADIGLIGACHPVVTGEMCNGCGSCVEACREDAISFAGDIPFIDGEKCLSCGKCIAVCPAGTLQTDRSGYRILLGGKLGRHPCLGTELPGIFNKDQILETIDRCVEYYKDHCVEGERLGEIMRKNAKEDILKSVIP